MDKFVDAELEADWGFGDLLSAADRARRLQPFAADQQWPDQR